MKVNKGFTIIELIISLFILTVAIIGIYSAFYTVAVQTDNISNRFTASYLAGEGMEIVRNVRDNNWLKSTNPDNPITWDNGLAICAQGCQADYKTGTTTEAISLVPYSDLSYLSINNDGFYSYETNDATETKFRRKIVINTVDTDILKVTVTVYWPNGQGGEGELSVEGYLYNWY